MLPGPLDDKTLTQTGPQAAAQSNRHTDPHFIVLPHVVCLIKTWLTAHGSPHLKASNCMCVQTELLRIIAASGHDTPAEDRYTGLRVLDEAPW